MHDALIIGFVNISEELIKLPKNSRSFSIIFIKAAKGQG
jgi:hypothetical protein